MAAASLFKPSAGHGAYPPELYNMRRADVMEHLPQLARLSEFLDGFVIRRIPGEAEDEVSAQKMPQGAATKAIEDFDYEPMIAEAKELSRHCAQHTTDRCAGARMFIYRSVARHIASLYLHIDQYCQFHEKYDKSINFLDQNFGLAKDRVPEGLETLVLETEKATRGYGPDDDSKKLLEESKLSFVLAYPDYAAAFCHPDVSPSDVHKLDAVAYNLGGDSEKYFKLMHLAVESKLGPLVEAAQAMIDGVPSEQRAPLLDRAADAARDAVSAIIKMPELSWPSEYLHLRFFIQGPYGSPSYPNGLTVRGVTIRPGGETGSQSSFGIMSDLLSGVRFNFQEDSLNKMEEIHRLTRERETIDFLDRLRAAASQCQTTACDAEKHARARLLQATNFYLLGHAAAYTIHVLAQQKSTVMVRKKRNVGSKEDVATGGSAGSFLIKKVLERQEFLEKLIAELKDGAHPFDAEANAKFKSQLELVVAHTEGEGREEGLDLDILRELVGFSEEKAVSIKPPSA